jgi:transposase-like protein
MRRYSKLSNLGIVSRITPEQRPLNTQPVPRRVNRRLSKAEFAQLVADYQAGTSTRNLASTYGISKASVTKVLTQHGVQRRFQGLSPVQSAEAARLYKAGGSVVQVAESLGRSPSSV